MLRYCTCGSVIIQSTQSVDPVKPIKLFVCTYCPYTQVHYLSTYNFNLPDINPPRSSPALPQRSLLVPTSSPLDLLLLLLLLLLLSLSLLVQY